MRTHDKHLLSKLFLGARPPGRQVRCLLSCSGGANVIIAKATTG